MNEKFKIILKSKSFQMDGSVSKEQSIQIQKRSVKEFIQPEDQTTGLENRK
jgi:hypothetical protein